MKILHIVYILFIYSLTGCAGHIKNSAMDSSFQRPPVIRVAALPVYNNATGDYNDVTFALASEFIKGGWRTVDRSIVDGIMEEQRFQMSGAVEKNAVQIGKLSGANFVATGFYNELPRSYLYIRLINVETGEIVATTSCHGNKNLGACAAKELVRLVNKE